MKEHKKQLNDFKKFTKKLLKSREDTLDFLVKVGINTKTGDLSEQYSSEK